MYQKLAIYLKLLFLATALFTVTGCAATWFGSPSHSVRIDSNPPNVNYTITDENGDELRRGTTPDSVVLRTSPRFFERARYYVSYDAPGYKPRTEKLTARVSNWYWADVAMIAYGVGLFGAFVVDPFTGSMYTLPDQIGVDFEASP